MAPPNPFAGLAPRKGGGGRSTANPFSGLARRAPEQKKETGGLTSKLSELENLVEDAEETGDESLFDRAKGLVSATTRAPLNAVGKVLQALDVGRAYTTSGIQELADVVAAVTPLEPSVSETDRVRQTGASFADFLENARNRVGVGEYIEADEQLADLPLNVKRAIGFAGDVAADPLTYVTLGAGSVAKKAGTELAEAGTRRVARGIVPKRDIQRRLVAAADEGRITKEVAEAGVERVQKLGAAALSPNLADKVGVRTGAMFGVGKARVVIPGTRQLGEAGVVALGPLRRAGARFVDSRPMLTRAAEAFDVMPGLRAERRKPGGIVRAFHLEESWRGAQSAGIHLGQTLKRDLVDIRSRYPDVDESVLRRAMEGDVAAREAVGDAWGELSDWYERAAVAAEQATGRKIPRFVDYLPHQASKELREYLSEQGTLRAGKKGKAGLETRRALRPGEPFMGETLKRGTIDEINEIASAKLGKDIKVFATDPWVVSASYAASIDWLVRQRGFIDNLRKRGLVEHFDLKAFRRAESEATKAERGASKATDAAVAAREAPISPQDALDEPVVGAVATDASQAAQAASERALRANVAATEATTAVDSGVLPSVPDSAPVRSAVEEVAEAKRLVDDVAELPAQEQVGMMRDDWQRRQLRVETNVARQQGLLRTLQELKDEAANIKAAGMSMPEPQQVISETFDVDAKFARMAEIDTERGQVFERLQDVEAAHRNPDLSPSAHAAHEAEIEDLTARLAALRDEKAGLRGKKAAIAPGPRKNAKSVFPPEAQERLGAIAADIARLNNELGVLREGRVIDTAAQKTLVDEIKRLRNDGPVLSKSDQERAIVRLSEATRVLAEEETVFNSAKAAYDDAVSAQTENLMRLVELEEIAESADLKARLTAREEKILRQRAEELYEAASHTKGSDPDLAAIARLEAVAEQANADAVAAQLKFEDFTARHFININTTSGLPDVLHRGLKKLNNHPNYWADPEMGSLLKSIDEATSPKAVGELMRAYDTVMSRWKAYALLYPGFHWRNWYGGVFNNSLAGVELASYKRWHDAITDMKRAADKRGLRVLTSEDAHLYIDAIRDPEIREAVRALDKSGVLGDTHVRDIADMEVDAARLGLFSRKRTARAKYDPTSLEFVPLALNRKYAYVVERQLRAPLFIDRFLKTGSIDEAADAVRKYHFDYSELSQLEKQVGRRLMPFYTWTRKNVPLQLEMIVRQPGKYTRYLHAKRNMELGTGEDEYVPSYYQDLLAIRTPWETTDASIGPLAQEGGSPVYLTPDLPFVNLAEVLEPRQLVSSMTPALTTPLQLLAGRQFFSDIPFSEGLREAPATWAPIMPVLWAAGGKLGLPRVERKNGKWFMTDSEAFKIEQTWPVMGRVRRLYPSEERYQNRAMTTYLSMLAGIGARTLDSGAQYGEVARRVEELKKLLRQYRDVERAA